METDQMDYSEAWNEGDRFESELEKQIVEAVKDGLKNIAKDYSMTIKEEAEKLGYSYSHTLSIMNGSKTLKLDFLDNLATSIGRDIEYLSIKYFQFLFEFDGEKIPVILTFNDERVTEFYDKFKFLYPKKINKKATTEENDNIAKEILRDVYSEFFYRKAQEEYDKQQIEEFVKWNRPLMEKINLNLVEEPDEFLKEINDYIEYRKYKKEEKK